MIPQALEGEVYGNAVSGTEEGNGHRRRVALDPGHARAQETVLSTPRGSGELGPKAGHRGHSGWKTADHPSSFSRHQINFLDRHVTPGRCGGTRT